MKLLKNNRLLLVLPALSAYILDINITLIRLPQSYWSGDFSNNLEANPIAKILLLMHPSAFIVGAMLYAFIFSCGIRFLPEIIAWWLSIILLIAHVSGFHSWFHGQHENQWLIGLSTNIAIAILTAACFYRYKKYSIKEC